MAIASDSSISNAPAGYRNYLLIALLVISVLSFVDRVALGVVLQGIKVDLLLSDTQLGILSGIAFALFYSVMGIPIARWADRGNRVLIIALSSVIWSAAVMACSLADSFAELLVIRIGVAIGEAGCIPPALSLIADYFGRAERPRATAVYGLAGPISTIVGFFAAGWLNEIYGWRTTFVLIGLPGLLLGLLAWLTLKEPRQERVEADHRYDRERVDTNEFQSPSLLQVCAALWRSATFRNLLICLAVMFFFAYGILQWLPALLFRSFDLAGAALGRWLAVTFGVAGIVGAYVGGELATRFAAHNERLQLRGLAITIACAGVASFLAYFSSSVAGLLGLTGLAMLGLSTVNGPLFATIQTLVPERMRAVAFSLILFVANLIGMGFGPLAAGVLSDALRPVFEEESLRYALLSLTPGYLWAAWHIWRASRTVTKDLALAQSPVISPV